MTLFTIGHGTAHEATFAARLVDQDVLRVVDVRRFPASRRWPWFDAAALAQWLPEFGIAYVPAPELGGRRTPRPDSINVALREAGFRGYADYMETAAFHVAFDQLLRSAAEERTAVMCSETLWWRCHRRLIADAAVLVREVEVVHIIGGKLQPHKPTAGVRASGGSLVYDAADG